MSNGRSPEEIRAQIEAGRQELPSRHLPGHQADLFSLGGVDIAAGEHDLEGPR